MSNPLPLDAAARDELARKAEAAKARADQTHAPRWYKPIELDADYPEDAVFLAACSPERILALLAAVERGEAETARLDFLEAFCDDLTFYHSRGGEPEPVLSWFAGDGDSVTQTQGPTWRAAIDAAMADASPDAARAHPPTQETDDA